MNYYSQKIKIISGYFTLFVLILPLISSCAKPRKSWDREADHRERSLRRSRNRAFSTDEFLRIDRDLNRMRYEKDGTQIFADEAHKVKELKFKNDEERKKEINDSIDKAIEKASSNGNE